MFVWIYIAIVGQKSNVEGYLLTFHERPLTKEPMITLNEIPVCT